MSLQEKEFLKMFHVPVVEVPTNLPNIRKDLPIQAFAVGEQLWSTFLFIVLYSAIITLSAYAFGSTYRLLVESGNLFVKKLSTCLDMDALFWWALPGEQLQFFSLVGRNLTTKTVF